MINLPEFGRTVLGKTKIPAWYLHEMKLLTWSKSKSSSINLSLNALVIRQKINNPKVIDGIKEQNQNKLHKKVNSSNVGLGIVIFCSRNCFTTVFPLILPHQVHHKLHWQNIFAIFYASFSRSLDYRRLG